MIDPVEEFLNESTSEPVAWVRKRDGGVVAFDTGKLASSVYAAFESVETEDAAFRSQEFTRAVVHFLGETYEGQIPTTDEISETVLQVLREVGQAAAAEAFFDFRQRRQGLREDLAILQARGNERRPGIHAAESFVPEDLDRLRAWDKSKAAQALQQELELDGVTARELATAVEKKLLALRLERVSSGLIRELVNCVFLERGLTRLLDRRRILTMPSSRLRELLAEPAAELDVHSLIGHEILEQFTLQEVFSRDVSGLHQEGLLTLHNAGSPCQWPALSADLPSLAMRCADNESLLLQFEQLLYNSLPRVADVLAIEALDSVLALSVQTGTDPVLLADKVCVQLSRIVRLRPVALVINLYGRIPTFVSQWLSEGPLFQVRPTDEQNRFARDFSEAFAKRVAESRDLRQNCRLDFHPDHNLLEDDFRQSVTPWAQRCLTWDNVSISFDRERPELAEGLRWNEVGRSGIYQYIGINLSAVYEKLGRTGDVETLTQRLLLLCESAVRAGVQKREFLRRQQPDLFRSRNHLWSAMIVVPVGLARLVAELTGNAPGDSDEADEFASRILRKMYRRLAREARNYQLTFAMDTLPQLHIPASAGEHSSESMVTHRQVTPTGGRQVLSASRIFENAGGGTCLCRLVESEAKPDVVLDILVQAKELSSVRRIRFRTSDGN